MGRKRPKPRKTVSFGFLPEKILIDIDGLSIAPLVDFDSTLQMATDELRHSNGFVYSPTYETDQRGKKVFFVPMLFKFFPTHSLSMHTREVDLYDYARNPMFFLLQVLGWATGYRLLPAQTWFDLRVPMKSQINVHRTVGDVEAAIRVAMKSWGRWGSKRRIEMTNLLYVFNRTPCYCWEFERFDFEYKIIDSCAKIRGVHGPHSARMRGLLRDLRISSAIDAESNEQITALRNNLVHELKWGQTLIAGPVEQEVFYLTGLLRRVNHRVLGRMLGINGQYFSTNAKTIGCYKFGPVDTSTS